MKTNLKKWAVDLVAVFALAASILSPLTAHADPCRGTISGSYRLPANSTHTFTECFRTGEWTQVVVSGDGTTDLDLYVYDGWGNLIASDTDGSDDCLVDLTVFQGGYFRVEVRNLGRIYNDYSIVMR